VTASTAFRGTGSATSPQCGSCHRPLFDAKPVVLNESNIQRHIEKNDLPVVVDFWAP